MPTEQAHVEIVGAVHAWQAEQDAIRDAERADAAEAAANTARHNRERLVAAAARVDTGETGEVRRVSTRRMNKAEALERAEKPGTVLRLPDGRRGLVLDIRVWFTSEDWASSTCWHAETHDQAHWDWAYTVAIVDPTPAEVQAEAEAAAELVDAAELAALVDDVARGAGPVSNDGYTSASGPRIQVEYGTTCQDGGRIILDGDRAIYQHPGYYDDYFRTERIITAADEPDLLDRLRGLIGRGPRTRVHGHNTYIISRAG